MGGRKTRGRCPLDPRQGLALGTPNFALVREERWPGAGLRRWNRPASEPGHPPSLTRADYWQSRGPSPWQGVQGGSAPLAFLPLTARAS